MNTILRGELFNLKKLNGNVFELVKYTNGRIKDKGFYIEIDYNCGRNKKMCYLRLKKSDTLIDFIAVNINDVYRNGHNNKDDSYNWNQLGDMLKRNINP